MIRIIKTKWLGRTETKPARIVATDIKTGERRIETYDFEADYHRRAAARLATDSAEYLGTNTEANGVQYHVYRIKEGR